jgi:hypothetical protein
MQSLILDVAGAGNDFAAELCDLGNERVEALLAARGGHDLGALRREQPGGGPADARAGTGY